MSEANDVITMKKWLLLLILALPFVPLTHGCHREEDIRTRFTIWAAVGVMVTVGALGSASVKRAQTAALRAAAKR